MAKSISRRLADSASPTGAIDGTLSTAAQTNITSVGTLSSLVIADGATIGSASDTNSITISSAGVVTLDQIPVFSAGINVSGGSIAGTLSTAAQANITSVGTLSALGVTGEIAAGSLDISGNIDIDGTTNLDVVDIDGAVDMASTLAVGGALAANGGAVFNEASADVDFRVESDGNTHALFVEGSTGNVGIGVTNPGQTLEIHNSATGDYTDFGLRGTGHKYVIGVGNDAVATVNDKWYLYDNDNGAFRMVVDTAGNVGIGISNPSDYYANWNDLVLGSTSHSGMTIASGTSHEGTIAFADGTSGNAEYEGYIQYDHADNTFTFGTDHTSRMTIDSSGYIQMGAPISTHIGTSQLFVNRGVNAAAATSGTTQTGGALRLRGGDNAVLDMGMNSVNTWIQATDRANLANGYPVSLNPNGGNVGIGVLAPPVKLTVSAPAADRETIRLATYYSPVDNLARGGITWYDGAAITGQIDTRYTGTTVDMHLGSLYSGAYTTTSRMIIKGSGEVTMPYQPAFDVYHPTGSYASGTTPTSLDLSSVRLNRGGHYSTSNHRFIAPVDGVYQFNYTTITNGAYNNLHIRMLKNAVILQGTDTHTSPQVSGAWTQVRTQIVVQLAVNDYVQVQHVGNVGIYGNSYQSFNGCLLG